MTQGMIFWIAGQIGSLLGVIIGGFLVRNWILKKLSEIPGLTVILPVSSPESQPQGSPVGGGSRSRPGEVCPGRKGA